MRHPRLRAPTQQQQQQQQHSSSSSSSSNPTARPAFTTLQQHYSPAKSLAPKPLTASFLAPPSPSKLPANVAASAETSRLQTELLQLHLLHRSAGPVAAQWRASARHKLAARFDRLVRAADDVARLDAGAAERRNVRALLAWQGHGHGHAAADFPPSLLGVGAASAENTGATLLEHKVQTLDAVLTGLWAVAEPGGRYARAVRRFERWAERVDALAELRRALASNSENHPAAAAAAAAVVASTGDDNGSGGGEDELSVLAGELDAAWKDECAGLVRRLDEWHRMLRGELAGHDDDGLLSTAEQEGDEGNDESGGEGSSLHRILTACRVLVADMLAELHAMDRIERDAVAAENAWVRAMNRDGEDDSPPAPARAGALWRVL
ncbi:hypothetical protein B0T26DRAFT_238814 [Lasiosphaeria miniovina]|uniref:Uncharacterized protein n=1 Tax=Lasiosphaeria miniovina TaxID=1954250 RepID=A0AA40AVN9_9PEZI|nr:uncharacterized protein B0T26DRAFT_238814 [Lasiosphaeria miniovina]KAK0722882.1 hypothetical protein B0T26DRAFT_238814 [Lasiosphaeria miniovina]